MNMFMRSMAAALLVSISGTTALAKTAERSSDAGTKALQQGLDAMAKALVAQNGKSPPGQSSRPTDPDMGDDRASDRAIFVVCNKDTPASERSAICDMSPE